MKPFDLLDLLRIPNVTTAFSDVLAATALAAATTGSSPDALTVGATTLASGALYCGGMALNDLADHRTDLQERPGRPLPSGRVRRGQALGITVFLLLAGLGLAAVAGRAVLIVAGLLVASILLYDLLLAGRPLVGPGGMALCRGLNWTMGLVAVGSMELAGIVALLLVVLYVFGLTHLSLGEVEGSGRAAIVLALLTTVVATLGVLILGRWLQPERSAVGWVALVASLALLWARSGPLLVAALVRPEAARIGPAVGGLVSAILWLDAGLATAAAAPVWLAPFPLLAAAQEWLRRRYPVT